MTTATATINYGDMDFNLVLAIQVAEQSKQAFISFIKELQIPTVMPEIIGWLEEFWNDHLSSIFFDNFWNGSLDIVTLYIRGEELPSLIDDMDACIAWVV